MNLILRVINKVLSRFNLIVIKRNAFFHDDKYLDRKEFRYVLWLDRIYSKICHVPGHIVELGVAKGRNSLIFGNLIEMNGDADVRRYFGFDTFDGYTPEDIKSSPFLKSSAWKDTSFKFVKKRIENAGYTKTCSFREGDLKDTLPKFLEEGADGFTPDNLRVALLYIDCNAYSAAIAGMEILKDYMSPGAVICIDEKQQGGETKALIEFCQRHGYTYLKDDSPFAIPAYTVVK
jgi:hypothetical protein